MAILKYRSECAKYAQQEAHDTETPQSQLVWHVFHWSQRARDATDSERLYRVSSKSRHSLAPTFGVFHAGPEKPNAKRTLNAAVTRQHKKDKVIDEDDEVEAADEGAPSEEREGNEG